MKLRKQSSTSYPVLFLLVSSTDHVTGVTGLSPTVTISKNGGAFASPSGAVSEVANGWYALAGNAGDRDTLGDLVIHATGTGADPVDDRYCVVPWDPFDATSLGVTRLDAAMSTRATPAQVNTEMDTALGDYDAPTKTEMDSAFAALNDLSAADILAMVYEGSETLQELLRLQRAVLVGKSSGGGAVYRDAADTKARVTATLDGSGNRTAVTVDAT